MYAKSISIRDFKCFGYADLHFQYPGREDPGASSIANINVILGDNGGGKSSILRAIVIAILARALFESGFVPNRLVRRGDQSEAVVEQTMLQAVGILHPSELAANEKEVQLEARIELRLKGNLDRLNLEHLPQDLRVHSMLFDDASAGMFVVGYGATRRIETGDYLESSARRVRGPRYQRVAGLFEEQVTLRPLQAWLPKLQARDPKRSTEVIDLINQVLPDSIRFTGVRDDEDDQYVFQFEGAETPFNYLSDGYKTFIGWIADLLAHMTDVVPPNTSLAAMPGIVLVDEIDLHLHPAWQRQVVPALSATFPAMQFFITSHSPLVVSTVRHSNVFVTDAVADGTATVRQLEEKVYGRSVEQLLLSSYFGLQSTRPEQFQTEASALFERAAQGDSSAALAYLERLIDPAKHKDSKTSASPSQ